MSLILSGTDGLSDIDGSAATPAIRGTDANTGIFFPAADTIGFAEGGAEAMRIDSGGSVRINNTSNATFSAQLNTQFASAFQCGQYLKVTDTSASQSMFIFGNSSSDAVGSIATSGSATSYNTSATSGIIGLDASTIAINTASSESMRIDSSGNVGIGTTSLDILDQAGASRPLVVKRSDSSTAINSSTASIAIVNGDTTTSNTAQLNFAAITGANTSGYSSAVISCIFGARTNGQYPTGQLAFSTSTLLNAAPTEKMRIDSSGNVGIGTTNPSRSKLVIGATTPQISFTDTDGSSNIIDITRVAGPGLSFSSNGSEKMRIDSSGNVGIGTSSPVAKLGIVGGTSNASSLATAYSLATFNITPKSTSGYSLQFGSGPSDVPYIQMSAGGSAAGNMTIQPYGGNVLIGTTAINTISPRLTILGMTAGNQWSCGPTSGNDSFFIYNQSSVGVYLGYGNTSWSSSSDERIKTAIIPFENALEKVCTLRAGTGRYLTDEETVSRSFLIAQDVQAVLPEAVNVQDDEIGTLGLQYTDVVPLLVAAIKEQQALIQSLTARITALESN